MRHGCFVLLLSIIALTSFAQPRGVLEGRVVTVHGKPAVGTTVNARSRAVDLTTISDENGRFRFVRVPLGSSYQITAHGPDGTAAGRLGRVYSAYATHIILHVRHVFTEGGACGGVDAFYDTPPTWFSWPVSPPRLMMICM
jgi:hypothetical protein